MKRLFAAAVLWAAAAAASAQPLEIPLLDAEPELVDFLSMAPANAVRARFAVVSGFTKRSPQNGVQSRHRADAYLGYDARNLYAIFVAFDVLFAPTLARHGADRAAAQGLGRAP